MLNNTIVR